MIQVQVTVLGPNHEDAAGRGDRIEVAGAGTKNLYPIFPPNRKPQKSAAFNTLKPPESRSRKNRDTNRDTKMTGPEVRDDMA